MPVSVRKNVEIGWVEGKKVLGGIRHQCRTAKRWLEAQQAQGLG